MKIPVNFENILSKNTKYQGLVSSIVTRFEEILEDNRLYFFEEYTGHGDKHFENVLENAASKIVSKKELKILDSENIAVLITSIFLHDIGMHIQYDGFIQLVTNQYNEEPLFNEEHTWKDLWEEYNLEAKRFTPKTLEIVFGNQSHKVREVDLEASSDELNGTDKKLIGEFIRRHHARLAHEIAIYGFPGGEEDFKINLENKNLEDISGLIARSHGMAIRDTFNYLQSRFPSDWEEPHNIKIVYLMAILRLSDYLQLEERTSPFTIKLRRFNSNFSFNEHLSHLAIDYAKPSKEDPETYYVSVSPKTSLMYNKLKYLFADIQNEFDKSWAILGEIYGKDKLKDQPKLKYRRIISNIDDEKKYSEQVDYVLEEVGITVSDKISKLLIAPLYGNNPTYGVRELLQNAVDACLAREFLDEESKYKPYVKCLAPNEKNRSLIIKDNGIGMTISDIKNYFLKIGSSIKDNSEWMKDFSSSSKELEFRRSGRFGIGILAAFLIGDKIKVKTKHIESEYSFSFILKHTTNQVQIIKEKGGEIGTTIEIEDVSNSKSLDLAIPGYGKKEYYKWYCYEDPPIEYKYDFSEGTIIRDLEIWNEIKLPDYKRVLWTYKNPWYHKMLICNGFYVCKYTKFNGKVEDDFFKLSKNDFKNKYHLDDLVSSYPALIIDDYNAKLNISLDRNSLTSELPMLDELREDVCKDLLAKLLTTKIKSSFDLGIFYFEKEYFEYDSIKESTMLKWNNTVYGDQLFYLYNKDGFLPDNKYFTNSYVGKDIFNFQIRDKTSFKVKDLGDYFYLPSYGEKIVTNKTQFSEENLKIIVNDFINEDEVFKSNNNEGLIPKLNKDSLIEYLWANESIDNKSSYLNFLKENNNEIEIICIYSIKLKSLDIKLMEVLKKYMGDDPVIPYKIEDRRIKFPKAFEELNSYMEKYI